jgi:hypothetical protein
MSGSTEMTGTRCNLTAKKPEEATKRNAAAKPAKGSADKKEKLGKAKPEKLEKLVCRYCGSDDLSPSFIQRRDRRCRKCFSKRYGSGARRNKTKQKK